jgi:RHS repeat-associated protein
MYGVMTDSNGLYYMRARFYNPEIRRFINQDFLLGRVVEGQTLNRYAFVTGRPVSYVDPFGLAEKDLNRAIDIVKTFIPTIYNPEATITFGDPSFSWWHPRRWWNEWNGASTVAITLDANTIIMDNSYAMPIYPYRQKLFPCEAGMCRQWTKELTASAPKLTQLLENVIHEYQHSNDYKYWNDWVYNVSVLFTGRHGQIYDVARLFASIYGEYMRMEDEEWEKVKKEHAAYECSRMKRYPF